MAAPRPIVRPPARVGSVPGTVMGTGYKTWGQAYGAQTYAPGVSPSVSPPPASPAAPPPGAQNPGTHPVTTTQTITPPPVAPFLTAAQQTALNQAGDNWSLGLTQQNNRVRQGMVQSGLGNPAAFDFNSGNVDQALNPSSGGDWAAAQINHDKNIAAANEALAARGMFQSSVRANDLADIDTALALRQNEIRTNLANLIGDATAQVTWLNNNWNHIQAGGLAQQIENAQNSPAAQPYQQTTTVQVPNVAPAGSPGSIAQAPAGQTPAPGRVPAMTGVTSHGGTDRPSAPHPVTTKPPARVGSKPGTVMGTGYKTWGQAYGAKR